MRPTLAAEELKRNLTQYLTTTFALADQPVREGLERFLNHPATRASSAGRTCGSGPRSGAADGDWRQHPGVGAGASPRPYLHQVQAWQRLSTHGPRAAEPTLVTTGTGSGKTEAFLIPVLDHCRREQARRATRASRPSCSTR